MIAAKCDRCGKLYETPKCVPNIRVFEYKHPYGDSRYDLCPECQKKLEEFLKGESDKILCISGLDLPYAMRVKSTNTEKKWRSSSL